MPPLYNEDSVGNPHEDFIGQKTIGWQNGSRQDALDLADFYAGLGDTEKTFFWAQKASETGIARVCLNVGIELIENTPERALLYLLEAFNGLQSDAIDPLCKLLDEHSPKKLGISPETHHKTSKLLRDLQEEKDAQQLSTIVLTGTRPVLFQKTPGPATFDNAQWGGGSLFVVSWQGIQFAVTALHVIENLGAERKEFRLLIPNTEITLEMYGGITPSENSKPDRDELDDIYAWHIKGVPDNVEDPGWWSWQLDKWNKPASSLVKGQVLVAAGYPELDERYDYENFKVVPVASILHGVLGEDTGVEGIYVMDVAEVEHPINLMSGGPVFARVDGFFITSV